MNYNSSDERCVDPNKTVGMDEACLSIFNDQNITAKIFSYVNECGACDGLPFANLSPNSNTTLVVPTRFEMNMYYTDGKDQWCHGAYKFQEYIHYGWNLTRGGCSSYYTIQEPTDELSPASYFFLGMLYAFCILGWLIIPIARAACAACLSGDSNDSDDDSSILDDSTEDVENPEPTPLLSSRSRIRSIDTFRGIAVLLMIYVNSGGGGSVNFDLSPWYGLTVADLVLPWFAWIMGLTLVVSLHKKLKMNVSRSRFILRSLRRSLLLVLLGLFINSGINVALFELRFSGVLQLLAISYFIFAAMEVTKEEDIYLGYGRFTFLEDILDCWPQWLIVIALAATHALVTFLLPVPGCPTGYLGPGGYHLHGKYVNCTGGAAGYIDRLVFGSHMYNKTDNPIYGQTLPHDPEGIMNTLSAVLIVALGVQAGRILVHDVLLHYNEDPYPKILRWFSWAAMTGIVAGFLCNWTREGGIVPVSKNMMTISFVLATSSFAFILYAVLFYLIDHKRIWNGAPFVYPGMNPIILYIGHYLTMGHLPWAWKIIAPTHIVLGFMNWWTTILWIFIAYVLYWKNIIITI